MLIWPGLSCLIARIHLRESQAALNDHSWQRGSDKSMCSINQSALSRMQSFLTATLLLILIPHICRTGPVASLFGNARAQPGERIVTPNSVCLPCCSLGLDRRRGIIIATSSVTDGRCLATTGHLYKRNYTHAHYWRSNYTTSGQTGPSRKNVNIVRVISDWNRPVNMCMVTHFLTFNFFIIIIFIIVLNSLLHKSFFVRAIFSSNIVSRNESPFIIQGYVESYLFAVQINTVGGKESLRSERRRAGEMQQLN